MEGTITKIEIQKKNKNRVNIFIDEEYSFACDEELVFRFNLAKGQRVDVKKIQEIAEEDNFIKGKNYALRILGKSYKTVSQTESKLRDRGYDEKIIERVIKLLKEYDLIDDRVYIKAYIKDNLSKQGKRKLLYNLKSKGITEAIIMEELNAIQETSLEEPAYKAAEKKLELLKKRETDRYKLSQKLSSYLLSRGYEYEMIKKVTSRLLELQEDE